MSTLGRLWAGHVYGTNTGPFFLEVDSVAEGDFTGTFRIMDNQVGLTVYLINGKFDGTALTLDGDQAQPAAAQGVSVATIHATGSLTPEGQIRGTWKSSIGTAGTLTFRLERPAFTLKTSGS